MIGRLEIKEILGMLATVSAMLIVGLSVERLETETAARAAAPFTVQILEGAVEEAIPLEADVLPGEPGSPGLETLPGAEAEEALPDPFS